MGTNFSKWLIVSIKEFPSTNNCQLASLLLVGPVTINLVQTSNLYPYKAARLVLGEKLYVEFYAWDLDKNSLRRKRLYAFPGITKSEKVQNAKIAVKEINKALARGYAFGEVRPENKENFLHVFTHFCQLKIDQSTVRMKGNITTLLNRVGEYLALAQLTDLEMGEIDKAFVLNFLDWIKKDKNLKNITRNNYLNYCRNVFNFMLDRGAIDQNPCKGIRKLPEHSTKNIPFTPGQKRLLDKYLTYKEPDFHTFCMCIYYGFLRPVEICRLKVGHINFHEGHILVRASDSKNAKQQAVALTPQLGAALAAYLVRYDHQEDWHLFSKGFKPGPTYMHRNRFSEKHSKILKQLGLYNGELTGYSWKHTGVVNAFKSGLHIRAIQEQCRHHSLEETEKYLRSMGLRIHRQLLKARW